MLCRMKALAINIMSPDEDSATQRGCLLTISNLKCWQCMPEVLTAHTMLLLQVEHTYEVLRCRTLYIMLSW